LNALNKDGKIRCRGQAKNDAKMLELKFGQFKTPAKHGIETHHSPTFVIIHDGLQNRIAGSDLYHHAEADREQ
jgi:hypothetical protein